MAIARDRLFGLRAITLLFHRHRDSPAILSKLCRLLRNLAHPQIAMASNVPSLLSGSSSGDSHSSYMGRTEANLSDELPDEASIGPILESLQRRLVVGDPPGFYYLPSMPVKPVEGPQWVAFTIPDQESSACEHGDVAALNLCSGTPSKSAVSGGALLRPLCLICFLICIGSSTLLDFLSKLVALWPYFFLNFSGFTVTRAIENRRYPLTKMVAMFQRAAGVKVTADDAQRSGPADVSPKSFVPAATASINVASAPDALNVSRITPVGLGASMDGPPLALISSNSVRSIAVTPAVTPGLATPSRSLGLTFPGPSSLSAGASMTAVFASGVGLPQASSWDARLLLTASSSDPGAALSSRSEKPARHGRSSSMPKSMMMPTVHEAFSSTSPESAASDGLKEAALPVDGSASAASSSSYSDTFDPNPPSSAPLPLQTMSDSALAPILKLGYGSNSAPPSLSFARDANSGPPLALGHSLSAPSRFVSTLHPSYNIYGVHGAPALRPMLMRSHSGPNPLAVGGSGSGFSYPVPQHPSVLPSINVRPRLHRAANQHVSTFSSSDGAGGNEGAALIPDPVMVPVLDSSPAALESCTPVSATFFACPTTASTPEFLLHRPGASNASDAPPLSVIIPTASDMVGSASGHIEVAAAPLAHPVASLQRRRLPSALDDVRNGNQAGCINSGCQMPSVCGTDFQPAQNISLVEALLEVLAYFIHFDLQTF